MGTFNKQNELIPDNTPVELPVGYKAPEPLVEMIQRLIRNENFRMHQAREGQETFEEADDFEVEDDDEIEFTSEFELRPMKEEYVVEREDKYQGELCGEDTESVGVEGATEKGKRGSGEKVAGKPKRERMDPVEEADAEIGHSSDT